MAMKPYTKIRLITTLGASTSFGIQRSARAAMGDVRRATLAVFPFPLIEAVTTRLLLKLSGEAACMRGAVQTAHTALREFTRSTARRARPLNTFDGRALRYFTYLVFAAFASAVTALFESCCEFMNFVTTSEIAPAAASG